MACLKHKCYFFLKFILRSCQHDNGYMDGQSQIKVRTDKRKHVHSSRSSLMVTHPSNNRGQRCYSTYCRVCLQYVELWLKSRRTRSTRWLLREISSEKWWSRQVSACKCCSYYVGSGYSSCGVVATGTSLFSVVFWTFEWYGNDNLRFWYVWTYHFIVVLVLCPISTK